MSKRNKRDIILEEIIRAYLDEHVPVGSSFLNERVQIPASTIRVYFKQLSNEGVLTQLHVSGGRIPTNLALRGYWANRLDINEPIYISDAQSFSKIVEDFGLYCAIEANKEECLDEVIEVKGRFLLLVLGTEQIVLEYDAKLFTFLKELQGISISDLKQLSVRFSLSELSSKLDYLKATKLLFKKGEVAVFDVAKQRGLSFGQLEDLALKLDEGLYFDEVPDGYMAVKAPAVFEGERSHLFCLGELCKDFESFFAKAKER